MENTDDPVSKRTKRNLLNTKRKIQSAKNDKAEKQRVVNLRKVVEIAEGNSGLATKEIYEGLTPSAKEIIEDATVVWQPNPGVQTFFLQAAESEVLFSGGRGSGKSDALIMDPLPYCSDATFRGVIIRRTMPELQEFIDRAKNFYPKAYPGTKWMEQKRFFKFPNGAKMEFGYCETEDDLLRYQGQEYSWIGVDELTQYANSNYFDKLKASCRKFPMLMRATTNPGGPGARWVKERFVDLAPAGASIAVKIKTSKGERIITRKWFQSTMDDNPHVSEDYRVGIESIQNESLRRQWVHGDWDTLDGVAFSEFRRDKHVVTPFEIPNSWIRFRACDWGFKTMAACLWFALDNEGNIYIYREHITTEVLDTDFAAQLVALEKRENIRYGLLDPSVWANRGQRYESTAEIFNKNYGLRFRKADNSKGARSRDKLTVHQYLALDAVTKEPRLRIFSNCIELIKELSSLPVDKNNSEDVDTNSVDHAYDALRYGLQSRPLAMVRRMNTPRKDTRRIVIDPTSGY